MDSIQYEAMLRIFKGYRMAPWEPEHAKFIEAEIAKLEVLEPNDAKGFREFYDKRLKDHLSAVGQDLTPQEPPVQLEEVKSFVEETYKSSVIEEVPATEIEAIEEKPKKKRGRKPKHS